MGLAENPRIFIPARRRACSSALRPASPEKISLLLPGARGSNGNFPAARTYVRRLVNRLVPHARAGLPIVSNSTSCGLMLKREAHEILGIEDDDLKVVSESMYDLCEFLLRLHDRGELRTDFTSLPMTVPYHAPCQQRGHGIGKPALDLLALVPDLHMIELDVDCCGIAGTYGLKKEKYEISMAVGARLFKDIRATGSDLAACDSETCRWQITHGTGVKSVHPIELLYRAYGLDRRAQTGSVTRELQTTSAGG